MDVLFYVLVVFMMFFHAIRLFVFCALCKVYAF